jgi:hypothetical protein
MRRKFHIWPSRASTSEELEVGWDGSGAELTLALTVWHLLGIDRRGRVVTWEQLMHRRRFPREGVQPLEGEE